MKKLIAIAMAAAALGSAGLVHAHGAKPAQYGGVVQNASDMQFELVNKDGKVSLYVDDHDEKKSVTGAKGKLTVLAGTDKKETTLAPGNDNALVAKDAIALPSGAKAVATVTFADGQTVTVRFTVK
ncbi:MULTISPECIES: hypothetical protein [Cupriavidus]|jgi:copper(I)-binding protein|uniref:hypothetical protein n=1 Tax=Cupriavidus TaxID=106589 RepID=UPI000CE05E79|nr:MULTISPECIES: hypothetical protein [Cupriavidus]AVA33766.1 hypothetical protein C3Z06_09120 [Cupriavidus metallidurans]MCA3182238.1 hypothetical protein [Cupriavidus sp.]MCA3194002.1 hypothetical protein [Cupriavidus sp.]MCA3198431.1 hypothetical protein [Cupriavidus sp.]MCA3230854.1 hypothetical protein [Cupriavidus sp.]